MSSSLTSKDVLVHTAVKWALRMGDDCPLPKDMASKLGPLEL